MKELFFTMIISLILNVLINKFDYVEYYFC
ncbi:MAG: hypothetical protein EZS26_000324 [Candidatus Ordinivivax streblomastigis]|uniref:Uncharacterized protein n=1 Tax=Candidatus Ordinivivax streblomastigis TaxID=2540710 RepID=A0A5M8P5N7_9BACT|nr:MAG: hypothetical protein EZS26_000324 [Candidatus Ordinivivax streblomastigis]